MSGVKVNIDLILEVGDYNALSKEGKEHDLKKRKRGIPDRRCECRGGADFQGQVPNLEPDSQARMVFSQPGCGKQFSNETPHESLSLANFLVCQLGTDQVIGLMFVLQRK